MVLCSKLMETGNSCSFFSCVFNQHNTKLSVNRGVVCLTESRMACLEMLDSRAV